MTSIKILSTTIGCAALLFSLQEKSHGLSGGVAWPCTYTISSPDIKLGSKIDIRIGCDMPGPWQELPVVLECSLPLNSEILTMRSTTKILKTENNILLRWEGLWSQVKFNNVQFKVTKPGFYKLYGRVSLGDISEKRLQEIILAIDNYPKLGVSESKLYRDVYFKCPNRFKQKLKDDWASIIRHSYYINVDYDSGRIETWDFSTYWKRARHWLLLDKK